MSNIPPTLRQRPLEGDAEARFSVGAPEQPADEFFSPVAPEGSSSESEGEVALAKKSFESLRADVTVALFNDLTAASIARPHLGPFLMDALDCALETLLFFEDQHQLCAVQEWLMQGWPVQESTTTAPRAA